MKIRFVTEADIPQWQRLSSEYDRYVYESVKNLKEWYDGNDDSPAFTSYMQSKIQKQEALMAVASDDVCLGVVAFSKNSNRITFFAVSHHADFSVVGNALFTYTFAILDNSRDIYINAIISTSEWMGYHEKLYIDCGFLFHCDSIENGVPVKTFIKPSTKPSSFS